MKKRIKKDIDLRCASSIDEMIQMCEECKFHACEGCEHTWTIVQEVKRLRDHERGEIQNQEKFAKDHGFTPDCTPYYIAEQYKHRAEVAERALDLCETAYILALNGREHEGISQQAIVSDLGVHGFFMEQAEKDLSEEGK